MNVREWFGPCVVGAVLLAGAVLSGCGSQTPVLVANPQNAAIEARWTLLKSADDPDPITRSQAIEALAQTAGTDCGNTYLQGLQDPAPVVRFTSALAIGDVQYKPALGQLLKMAAKTEPDKRVFTAVVYALWRLDNSDYTRELGKLLFDKEKEVRADVALAMGKIGHVSAEAPLKALRGTEQAAIVQLQINESLAMLGDERAVASMEANAKSVFIDERLVAIPALARIRDRRAIYLLRDMVGANEPVRVRIAVTGALAQLGYYSEAGYRLCILAMQEPNKVLRDAYGPNAQINLEEVSSTQVLSAISLGYMGNVAAVDVLLPTLKSADGPARVAAAMSILRLLPAYRHPEPPRPAAPATVPATAPAPKPPAAPKSQPAPVKPTPAPVKPVPPTTKPAPAPTKTAAPVAKTAPASAPAPKPVTTRPRLMTSGAREQ